LQQFRITFSVMTTQTYVVTSELFICMALNVRLIQNVTAVSYCTEN
jgi:hypothetical protein